MAKFIHKIKNKLTGSVPGISCTELTGKSYERQIDAELAQLLCPDDATTKVVDIQKLEEMIPNV